VEEEDRLAKMEAEENNPMKALENRTTDSKREMDILDALQDIRARNARNERTAKGREVDELLERIGMQEVDDEADEEELERLRAEEEDERLVREVFSKVEVPGTAGEDGVAKTVTVKRKVDVAMPELPTLAAETSKAAVAPPAKKAKVAGPSALGIKIVKKKKAVKA